VTHEECRRYLEDDLTYRLGDREREGLSEFFRRAAAADVLPSCSEVWVTA
jgi:hypothetical protein